MGKSFSVFLLTLGAEIAAGPRVETLGRTFSFQCLGIQDVAWADGDAWRIIPVSKWLGSPPFISHLGRLEGEQPQLGDLLIMLDHAY